MEGIGDGRRREHLYGLEGIRLDAYDAIVRPDQVFAIRVYTLRRWAPILGASGFWLLVALQQQCYRNPRGDDWCVVSRSALATEAGLSEATVHRYLHGSEYASSGLCHWIQLSDPKKARRRRRWSSRAGRMTQAPNRYVVVMDAPLAPIDQRGLAQFLQERGAAPGASSAEITPALEQLAGLQLADLLRLLEEHAARFQPPTGWQEDTFCPTVADVVMTLGIQLNEGNGNGDETPFFDLCSRVQEALVGQVYLGTHYFRERWVPLLGHRLALVVTQLRSLCFWSEDMLRDRVAIGTEALATVSACTSRWLRLLCQDVESPARQFFTMVRAGRGRRPPTFHVTLREPIAPQDEAEYRALLNSGVIVPETGQLGLPEPDAGTVELREEPLLDAPDGCLGDPVDGSGERLGSSVGGSDERLGSAQAELVNVSEPVGGSGEHLGSPIDGTGERLGSAQAELVNVSEPIGGTGERLGSSIGGSGERLGDAQAELVNVSEPVDGTGERLGSPVGGTGEQHVSTITISTNPRKALRKQKHAGDPAAVTASLLDDFGIGPPNSNRILARSPDPDDVRAWMLYTLTQSGLDDPVIACGYVVNRLLAGDAPPARFRRWARLMPDRWQALWRAGYYGGSYRTALPPGLAEDLDAWVADFDGIFPAGPFGDGLLDEERLCSALSRLGDPPGDFSLTVQGNGVWLVPHTDEAAIWLQDHVTEIRETWSREGVLHRVEIAPVEARQMDGNEELSSSAGGRLVAARVWQATLGELQLQMTQATFDTWLRDSRLFELGDHECIVGVKSDYAKDWLEHRLLTTVERTLARLTGRTIAVKFVVQDVMADVEVGG